jgi:hypothetical protein
MDKRWTNEQIMDVENVHNSSFFCPLVVHSEIF